MCIWEEEEGDGYAMKKKHWEGKAKEEEKKKEGTILENGVCMFFLCIRGLSI